MAYEFYITPDHYRIAEQNGICARLVTDRVRVQGWPIEEAITKPSRKANKYGKWTDIAKENNISMDAFYKRVTVLGMSIEKAATMPVMQRRDIIEAMAELKRNNTIYPIANIKKAEQKGVKYDSYRWRLRHGWSVEDATNTSPLTKEEVAQRASAKSYWKKGPKMFIKERVTI